MNREIVRRGHYLEFRVDTIRRADGSGGTRDVVGHPGAIAVLAMDDDRRLLLVRQWRIPAGRAMLEIPAGTLDVHDGVTEDPDLAARRELEEETGHRAAHWRKLAEFWTAPGFATELMHLYLATGIAGATDDDRLTPRRGRAAGAPPRVPRRGRRDGRVRRDQRRQDDPRRPLAGPPGEVGRGLAPAAGARSATPCIPGTIAPSSSRYPAGRAAHQPRPARRPARRRPADARRGLARGPRGHARVARARRARGREPAAARGDGGAAGCRTVAGRGRGGRGPGRGLGRAPSRRPRRRPAIPSPGRMGAGWSRPDACWPRTSATRSCGCGSRTGRARRHSPRPSGCDTTRRCG